MSKENMYVKLVKEIEVTELDGEKVMIDFETGKYFLLKGSGSAIWDMMQDGDILFEDIINNLLEEYDVEEDVCKEAVDAFLDTLLQYEFIELVEK